jgi:hypothetical protein
LLEAAPPDEGGGGSGRALMPYAKDADDVDPDADDADSSSDEVRQQLEGFGLRAIGTHRMMPYGLQGCGWHCWER